MKLKNKVAIITGASSGIGEATAVALATEGVSVVLAARRVDRLEQLKDRIEKSGGDVLLVPTDVTKRAEVEKLTEKTIEKYERVDILINNAGVIDF